MARITRRRLSSARSCWSGPTRVPVSTLPSLSGESSPSPAAAGQTLVPRIRPVGRGREDSSLCAGASRKPARRWNSRGGRPETAATRHGRTSRRGTGVGRGPRPSGRGSRPGEDDSIEAHVVGVRRLRWLCGRRLRFTSQTCPCRGTHRRLSSGSLSPWRVRPPMRATATSSLGEARREPAQACGSRPLDWGRSIDVLMPSTTSWAIGPCSSLNLFAWPDIAPDLPVGSGGTCHLCARGVSSDDFVAWRRLERPEPSPPTARRRSVTPPVARRSERWRRRGDVTRWDERSSVSSRGKESRP